MTTEKELAIFLIVYIFSMVSIIRIFKLLQPSENKYLQLFYVLFPGINTIVALLLAGVLLFCEIKYFLKRCYVDYECWIIREKAKIEVRTVKQIGFAEFIKRKESELSKYKQILKESYQGNV